MNHPHAPFALLLMIGAAACAATTSERPLGPPAPQASAPASSSQPLSTQIPPPEAPAPTASAAASSPVVLPPPEKTPPEKARAVFDEKCASCHADGANPKAGKHLKLAGGVLAGHHAGTLGKTMRRVLGVGGKATMPPGGPALAEEERQLLVAWADEQDHAPSKKGSHTH